MAARQAETVVETSGCESATPSLSRIIHGAAPGEVFQFDRSEDWASIGGVSTKPQVAHFKLNDSHAFNLRAYLTQTHEIALAARGGVAQRGTYDMKTVVGKLSRGKMRAVGSDTRRRSLPRSKISTTGSRSLASRSGRRSCPMPRCAHGCRASCFSSVSFSLAVQRSWIRY